MNKEVEAQPRGNWVQKRIRNWLSRRSVNYEIFGIENLTGVNPETGAEKTRNLRSLLSQGETAIILPNHPSYGDFPTYASVVSKEQDLQEFMGTLVISEKYTNNPILGAPIRALSYGLDLRVESVNPHKYGGDKKKSGMNSKAQEHVRQSQVGIAVMQGTHSVEMQPARWGSVRWWEGKTYLVPVAFRGTDKQWQGGLSGFFRYIKRGKAEQKATLIIGEPVSVSNMEKVAEVYSEGDPDPKALEKNRVDFPTQLIVDLHNEYVRSRSLEDDPEETKYTKGYYEERSKYLADHPITLNLNTLSNLGEVVVKQEDEKAPEPFEERSIKPLPRLRFEPGSAAN